MKFTITLRVLAAAAVMAGVSMPASAGFTVLDGWNITIPGFNHGSPVTDTYTNIGHLVLGGGSAIVSQQVDSATHQVFVGSQFVETGMINSISYITENVVGNGDFGTQHPFGLGPDGEFYSLNLAFTGVAGFVDSLISTPSGTGYHYTFTSGTVQVQAIVNGVTTTVADASIIGLGGDTSTTNVIGGTTGSSTLLAQVADELFGFDVADHAGNSLAAGFASGAYLFQATTTNTLNQGSIAPGGCSFDPADTCVNVQVTSEGALNVVQKVPEPASLALVGLALGGLGLSRRRAAKKAA